MSLISQSQMVPADAAADALDRASAEHKARTDSAALAATNAAAAAANNNEPAAPAAVPLPAVFLAMPDTKQQQADAISLYYSQHQALATARDDLTKFKASCNKRAPHISLPKSIRSNFSQAHFVAVEDNAAFYKQTMDALNALDQQSANSAYKLIVQGKESHILHLQLLLQTQTFVSRALQTYSSFVKQVNTLYANRGSSLSVPVESALAHFENKLRQQMLTFDTQQIQASLTAARKKQETAEEKEEAEEQIMAGSHDGTNIAQIATKAVKAELAQTKKQLAAAHRSIADLQDKFNRQYVGSSSRVPSKPATVKSKAPKRKEAPTSAAATKPVNPDAMSDEPMPSKRQSNSKGGGRPIQHQSKKSKRDEGKEGNAAMQPTQQKRR